MKRLSASGRRKTVWLVVRERVSLKIVQWGPYTLKTWLVKEISPVGGGNVDSLGSPPAFLHCPNSNPNPKTSLCPDSGWALLFDLGTMAQASVSGYPDLGCPPGLEGWPYATSLRARMGLFLHLFSVFYLVPLAPQSCVSLGSFLCQISHLLQNISQESV